MAKTIIEVKKEVKVSVKIKNMMKKVAEIQAQEAQLKKQKDALKAEIKQFMVTNKMNEILVNTIKALYTTYESETFDTKLFKEERPKLYKQYLRNVPKERFEVKDAKAGK